MTYLAIITKAEEFVCSRCKACIRKENAVTCLYYTEDRIKIEKMLEYLNNKGLALAIPIEELE